jgi:hypothetical protein
LDSRRRHLSTQGKVATLKWHLLERQRSAAGAAEVAVYRAKRASGPGLLLNLVRRAWRRDAAGADSENDALFPAARIQYYPFTVHLVHPNGDVITHPVPLHFIDSNIGGPGIVWRIRVE